MFESLSDRLSSAFRSLSGRAQLTEENIRDGLREVRLALLEADVNFKVVKQFVKDDVPWIHFDIAGTAFNEKKDETGLFGATGVGIKTIMELLRSMATK